MKGFVSFETEKECINFINARRSSVLHGFADGQAFDSLRMNGYTHQLLKDKDGRVKLSRWVPNLIPTAGKAAIAGLIVADVGGTAFDYMAIGTGTTSPAAGNTALETEITDSGGERGTGTGTRVTTTVTNDTAQLVKSWTFTGSKAVTEAGILNAGSGGTLLARQTFSAINVVSGDSLQITWKIAVS